MIKNENFPRLCYLHQNVTTMRRSEILFKMGILFVYLKSWRSPLLLKSNEQKLIDGGLFSLKNIKRCGKLKWCVFSFFLLRGRVHVSRRVSPL